MKKHFAFLAGTLLCYNSVHAQQELKWLKIDSAKNISSAKIGNDNYRLHAPLAVISYELNKKVFTSSYASPILDIDYDVRDLGDEIIHFVLHFKNRSGDTISVANVHPFTDSLSEIFITGMGDHPLSRTYLFLPGKKPVNVIVPDNAWELGYAAIKLDDHFSLAALTRRNTVSVKDGEPKRFETVLYPGGIVDYNMYFLRYAGDWQAGLTKVFQEKLLFDVDAFNDSLFHRKDLQWIRKSYVIHLMDAWDKFYYDIADGRYHLKEFLEKGKQLYGGDDVVSIWPTWPTLGLDQRNQFELFNDLPGGIKGMKKQADVSHELGTKFFICYNPWDESTDNLDHFEGLSALIRSTGADGVVLDTKAEAGKELQDAADKEKPGVIMYSEGMAVPKDMAGIVSGRVHNALYYPPMLNLNKLIKPEFAIFRVAELYKEKIRREFALAFFNGYGTEINIMAPGQPDWAAEQYRFLGSTTRILRENTDNFTSKKFTPLIHTAADSIWVNKWSIGGKNIYTIYSIIPKGFKGNLFETDSSGITHFVDLWHHRLLSLQKQNGKWYVPAEADAFNAAWLGTNNEGAVDCIAEFPKILTASINDNILKICSSLKEGEIRVWAGVPAYDKNPLILKASCQSVDLLKNFGRYEGDFIIQYLKDDKLSDETIVTVAPGTPRLISINRKTVSASNLPIEMVKVPAGNFTFHTTNGDEFIPYPKQHEGQQYSMPAFWIDKFPVTNKQFEKFITTTKYKPTDTANFLKHWLKGKIPEGKENFPVVYISYEDALAFAKWAGKRLPSEQEWQYAAQAGSEREWPWDQLTPVKRRNEYITNTLTVVHLDGLDSSVCNLGNGNLYTVGTFPKGANPYGVQDLVGCVWQLTNDLYMQGSHRYIMMKGGSFFKPTGSWWYVQGGPRELHYRQYLLRVSQGFERNATVGFRCVKD